MAGRGTALLFAACAVLFAACSNTLLEKAPETVSAELPAGYGAVAVNLSAGTARTVIPVVGLESLSLEYWFAKDGGTAEKKEPADGKFILEAGSYALTVKGFVTANDQDSLAAQGEAPFTITAGTVAETVNVVLRPVVTEGAGSLEFGLQYPEGVTVETLALTRIAGSDSPLNLLNPAPSTVTESGVVTLHGSKTGIPAGYYLLQAVLQNGDGVSTGKSEVVHIYQNLTAKTVLAGYTFTAADFKFHTVTTNADSGSGSLRQALTDAQSGQLIKVTLEPGSVIELASALPEIAVDLTIAGNGVTLTRAAGWTAVSETSQLLYISSGWAAVKISGVHFKNGRASNYGGAIRSNGVLTLDSCIFSGNQSTGSAQGGAVAGYETLTIRGCTFYGNSSGGSGGAVYFTNADKTLTLEGNLFYGNTAATYPAVHAANGSVSASYNAVDASIGTAATESGWTGGTGNTQATALPVSPLSFKLLSGSGALNVVATLPEGYPATDFNGTPITANAAAGAVQAAAGSGYYLDLSVNNSNGGEVTPISPDSDGLVATNTSITASANTGYILAYWLVNGAEDTTTATLSLSGHSFVQAVFKRTVTNFTDTVGSAATTAGTLRYALTNAQDGDTIAFVGVTAGTTKIELTSPLLISTAISIAIEGNGITLTPDSGWAVGEDSQLLRINNDSAVVTINRVHFKDGRATRDGGAIFNSGLLTLESCIFSGNQNTGSASSATIARSGGAIYSYLSKSLSLTVRGCTFNGNSAYQGGAIYIGQGTLNLTGNIFFANTVTGSSYLVVRQSNDATIVASYNVVDKAFGLASRDNCGWAAGTGDKTLIADTDDLTISGDPFNTTTFAPVSGLAGTLSNTKLADFPETDFYGNTRTFPGASGAVEYSVAE
jgi:predicted outer membrane repeat protein